MKPAIVFVIAFVATTAASAGAKVVLTKPAPVEADSTKHGADSTHVDSMHTAHTDTAVMQAGQVNAPPSDTMPRAAVNPDSLKVAAAGTPKAAVPGAPVAPGASPAAATPARTPVTPGDTLAQASERRLAKVFTAMDAKQAAKVLEHMQDADVQIILGYVGPRQAADIMSALPPERVAVLSKMALQVRK